MAEQLLAAPDVAKMLGRSESAIRQMTFRRELPFRKLGRRVVYFESEIMAVIESAPGLRPNEIEERSQAGRRS